MGSLGEVFAGYLARWPHEGAVAADAGGFARETREVLRALAARIAAEDHELFPAADGVA
jgi:hypothetical protein